MLHQLDVILVGYFSGKDKEYEAAMDRLAARAEAAGARIVGRFVQRRGVSHGGVGKMTQPMARRTLISGGKVREIAEACRATGAAAVIFVNDLTAHQRNSLENEFGCVVYCADDLPG